MRRHAIVAVAALCSCASCGREPEDEGNAGRDTWPPATIRKPTYGGAAKVYDEAFKVMPELTEADEDLLKACATVDLDTPVRRIVARSEKALELMHRAAALKECTWGTNLEDEPGAYLPHLEKARQMAWLACLRARWLFKKKRDHEAFDDLAAVLVMGRRVERESLLIGLLVRLALERDAVGVAAANLVDRNREALKAFATRLDALPPPTHLGSSSRWIRQRRRSF